VHRNRAVAKESFWQAAADTQSPLRDRLTICKAGGSTYPIAAVGLITYVLVVIVVLSIVVALFGGY
jgi:hypothetical protein